MVNPNGHRPARTVLEQKIRERNQTLEEFIDYVEKFRHDQKEPGTLSLRHLERLIAGHRGDGRPLGPLRPATARLLERMFGRDVTELLAPPVAGSVHECENELRQRLNASRQVDEHTIHILRGQLEALRQLDRQFGARVTYHEVVAKAAQVAFLQAHCMAPHIRSKLSVLVAELNTLAGWEALDCGEICPAWEHHEQAKLAARDADSTGLLAHSLAQQAVILIDLGEAASAVQQLAEARKIAERSAPALLRSWLAAAHGEGLAAAGHTDDALRAFDAAHCALPKDPIDPELPFLFLGGPHLARWRGHVLAVLRSNEATTVLADALRRLDPKFTRAETALRVDLAAALMDAGRAHDAQAQLRVAGRLAAQIGSARQQRRIHKVTLLSRVH